MDTNGNIIKNQIANLGFADFCKFVLDLLKTDYEGCIDIFSEIGQDALLRYLGEVPHMHYAGVYFLDQIPLGLFKNPDEIIVDNPYVRKKMQIVFDNFKRKYYSKNGYENMLPYKLNALYFITNLYGYGMDFYQEAIIPKYEKIAHEIANKVRVDFNEDFGYFGWYTGSPDSFYEFEPETTIQSLSNLFAQKNAISIELSNNTKDIRLINTETPFQSGVGRINKSLFAPVYSDFFGNKNVIIEEFEYLLKSNPSETKLEKFIKNNYQDIFGPNYDRIETQIWLKFPKYDINNKNRRLDVFMHNIIKKDWELFELKKIINLTKTYRDIPILSSEIYNSIQQVKNYDRLLKNPLVKEYFLREGIEYYEPTLHLVVGNEPSIDIEQWRWLVTSNKDVNLLTYSELFNEMEIRHKEKEDFLNNYFKNNT